MNEVEIKKINGSAGSTHGLVFATGCLNYLAAVSRNSLSYNIEKSLKQPGGGLGF